MKPQDRVTGCNTLEPVPVFVFQGLAFPVVVDVPSGGWLQVVVGENPLAIPTPGIQLGKGEMLVLIKPDFAEKIRPHLQKAHAEAIKLRDRQNNGAPSIKLG